MLGSQLQQQGRNYGQYADLPEKLQSAVDSGLGFFELRYRGAKKFTQNVFGFYDVVVERVDHPLRQGVYQYEVKWLTGRSAKLAYNCINQKTGLSVGFMVDDPFWHNRVMLAFNPTHFVFAYHTNRGQVDGLSIIREIECIRDVLQENVTQYVAVNFTNQIGCASTDEKEVDAFLAMKARPKNQPQLYRKGSRKIWLTRPEISEVIRNNAHEEYGWTDSREFRDHIKPKILQAIGKKNITQTAITPQSGSVRDAVMEALRTMSASDLRSILAQKEAAPPEPEPEATTQETTEPEARPQFITKTAFRRLIAAEAKEEARIRMIPGYEVMNREELIKALIADEEQKKADWDNRAAAAKPDMSKFVTSRVKGAPAPEADTDIDEDTLTAT
jgi:hypothetical protein